MKKKHDRHLSSNKRDLEIAKKSQKGDPEHFGLISGDLRVFFMFSWGEGAGGCWDHFWWGLYLLCLP